MPLIRKVGKNNYNVLLYLCDLTKDHVEVLELLLNNGADTSATTKDGKNALHLAADSLCPNMVKKLIEFGFDPNAIDHKRQTPLHITLRSIAGYHEMFDIVKTLVEAGADIRAEDDQGLTPLAIADDKWIPIAEYLKSL